MTVPNCQIQTSRSLRNEYVFPIDVAIIIHASFYFSFSPKTFPVACFICTGGVQYVLANAYLPTITPIVFA